MKFSLPYDKTILEPNLPDDANVITLKPIEMTALGSSRTELTDALGSPPEGRGIEELVRSVSGKILIVVPDHTRICGKEVAVSWIIDLLVSYGVNAERISVLVALGSHKPAEQDVLQATLGDAFDKVNIIQHDPALDLTDYGTTSRGTRVLINPHFTASDLVILYTSAVHHYFAGFGGGRKIIVPGIASLDTISSNHSLVFDQDSGGQERHPMVKSGQLTGNPVHEDMLEAANLALKGKNYITITTVMTPQKEFAFFTAGEIDASHRRACAFVESHNCVEIDKLADVVIASAGGFPKDTNVIQSHKGMDNAVRALKPGGTLLYLMSCSQGTGNPAVERFAPWDKPKIREELARDYVIYGQTVYAMKEKVDKYNIIVMTYLDPELIRKIGFDAAGNLDDGVRKIAPFLEDADMIYHIPRADITLPSLLI